MRLNDESVFERIFLEYWERMYDICFHFVGDRAVAEELVQDIFRSLWERRDSLLIDTGIENYLVKAARLKSFEHLRNTAIETRNLREISYSASAAGNHTENLVYYNALTEQVGRIVNALPEQCQKVFRMSRENGMNNKQIAHSLAISEKTVENQITKALRTLRLHLGVDR
ncbi:RNA polymerase sigma-70 factor, ECF subfamily [Dyadobacter sp. SG02]|uniref:RNA polymerase sigma-70 factor n=1 Tax=Dyadobacter sp. SG02 TaxID=1855291 RepID=UPI0008B5FC77|nr:RNA polymerase sigma-70 factor [Dyadobacter sp. SG02]SEI38796.1 RNA polymerase sigma-70 factor, ECF subfamily [Dyadobacter sp. SG02]